jgi:5-methylcytosine-specific restriction endonuclease McrA
MKTCSRCGVVKTLDEFTSDKRAKDGRYCRCRECTRETNAARRRDAGVPVAKSRVQDGSVYCPRCEQTKPVAEFHCTRSKRTGRVIAGAYCRPCHAVVNEANRKKYETREPVAEKRCTRCGVTKPASEFSKVRSSSHGLSARCSECRSVSYYVPKRTERIVQAAAWKAANPDRARMHSRSNAETRRARKRNQLCTVHPECRNIDLRPLFDGAKCCECGKKLNSKTMTVDHTLPLAKGGIHCRYNLRPLCGSCNSSKGAKVPAQVPLFMLSEHPAVVARIYGWEVTANE